MKINWKQHLKNRLKIIAFIFALVGWFMLVTVPLEKIFSIDLSGLEAFVETDTFQWGLKIFVVVLLILLIKGQAKITEILEKNKTLKIILKIITIGGAIGWVVGLASLLV